MKLSSFTFSYCGKVLAPRGSVISADGPPPIANLCVSNTVSATPAPHTHAQSMLEKQDFDSDVFIWRPFSLICFKVLHPPTENLY